MTGTEDTTRNTIENPDTEGSTATGPGSAIGKRITGESDPRDPDGLLTLDDLPDRSGAVSDLSDLARKASQYGEPQEGETSAVKPD
jgi:hypothetical protein